MKVRDIMTAEVVTARPDTTVNGIAWLMAERGLSGIPILSDDGRLAGIVTELDLIVRNTRLDPPAFFQLLDGSIPLETPGHYRKRLQHMLGTLARDVMTQDVLTIGPDDDVESLAELFMKRGVNPVPVIEQGRLAGIVSRTDIIKMMARDLNAES